MIVHSRFWWFVLFVVVFLVLATVVAAGAKEPGSETAAAPASVLAAAVAGAGDPDVMAPSEDLRTVLAAKLLLHVVATVVALRLGMKIFYESAMLGGFLAIIAIDALVTAVMIVGAPLSEGFTAMLGPQLVVTGLVMMLTLRRYGFTKTWFTVIPTVLVTKVFAAFGEIALRMLFLEAVLRWAALCGW